MGRAKVLCSKSFAPVTCHNCAFTKLDECGQGVAVGSKQASCVQGLFVNHRARVLDTQKILTVEYYHLGVPSLVCRCEYKMTEEDRNW